MQNSQNNNVWTMRFGRMALIHGLFFLAWTGFIALPSALGQIGIETLEVEASRIIAGGSAGMWFTMGYIFYFLAGIMAVGLFAVGYLYVEKFTDVEIEGGLNLMAWLHFAMVNLGAVLSTWLLMYAGYNAGAMLSKGEETFAIHTFLEQYAFPIGLSVLLLVIGVLVGIIFLAFLFKKHTGSWLGLESTKAMAEAIE